jgi:4-hydroxy-tetrahydrodipicolinate reductase
MAIRVVQWGTGTAGLRALRAIVQNPSLELAGLYVARAERAGRDAGSFVDLPETGVLSTNTLDELLALKPDCLCYMGSYARGGIRDVLPFLRAGINVVTPGIGSLLVAEFAKPEIRDPIEQACREGSSSFFSTGASPGYCTDYFPMAMLGIVDEVREVIVQEIADYSSYPVEAVARAWGFGNQPGEPIPIFEGDGVTGTWAAIPRDIARRLGVEIEEVRLVTDVGLASRDVETAFYTIPKGTVANIRFGVEGLVNGKPFVTMEHVNYCDFDGMPPDWPRPHSPGNLHYRTIVKGRPNLNAEIELDYPIAGVRTVNSIPAVVAAAPGILAGADVPALASGNVTL